MGWDSQQPHDECRHSTASQQQAQTCLKFLLAWIYDISLKLELTDARLFWGWLYGLLKFSWRWGQHQCHVEKPSGQNTLL